MNEEDYKERLKAIGARIRQLRLEAGFENYKKFADHYDIEQKSYWRWENGQNYKTETILRITDIHDITLEEFFKGLK